MKSTPILLALAFCFISGTAALAQERPSLKVRKMELKQQKKNKKNKKADREEEERIDSEEKGSKDTDRNKKDKAWLYFNNSQQASLPAGANGLTPVLFLPHADPKQLRPVSTTT